jgi:acetyl-CoA synthetase
MKDRIETLLHEKSRFEPPAQRAGRSLVPDYEGLYRHSIADLEGYWERIAGEFAWSAPWSQVLEWKVPDAKWFVGARCNITENCLDRHLDGERKNKVALVWLGEDGEERIFTFGSIHRQVSKLASALRDLGLRKGDRVAIYMPLTPEGIIAMLACPKESLPCSPVRASAPCTAWSMRGSGRVRSVTVSSTLARGWSSQPTSGIAAARRWP